MSIYQIDDEFLYYIKNKIRVYDKYTVIQIDNNYATCYGKVTTPINSRNTYKWTLQPIKIRTFGNLYIGIDESSCKWKDTLFCMKNTTHYGYSSGGYEYNNGSHKRHFSNHTYGASDRISMILNFQGAYGTLQFFVNSVLKVTFDQIPKNKNYKMAVCTFQNGDSVKLLEYHCDVNTNNNNNIDKFKQLQKETNKLKNQVVVLNQAIQKLQKDNYALHSKVNKLQNDEKELLIENKNLKLKIKQLQSKDIDIKNYPSWNHENIVTWILSLDNNRYLKYESKLRKSLKEEGVTGNDLHQVDGTDIKGWGVINFADKKALLVEIQKLTSIEGSNASTY